jgi:hypothetical protein
MNQELYLNEDPRYRVFRVDGDSVVVSVPLPGCEDVGILRRFNVRSFEAPSMLNTESFIDESSGLTKLFRRPEQQAQDIPGPFPGSFMHFDAAFRQFLIDNGADVKMTNFYGMPDF